MKRSTINEAIRNASACFERNAWALPPEPRWDVTDFGLGDFSRFGLVLINLADEPEYCEKLMYARKGQITPAHCHKKKKEDIIVRSGQLRVQVWKDSPKDQKGEMVAGKLFDADPGFSVSLNGRRKSVHSGDIIRLKAGERITLIPGVYHEFVPETEECIIGEVSTANDDLHDNFFVNPLIGRYARVQEDETPLVKLVSDPMSL